MSWGARTVEESRNRFVKEVLAGEATKSALCRKYQISRPTGDKWLERYQNGEGMQDRSHAPFHTPNKTSEAVEEKVLAVRREHPAWGPRKIRKVLENQGETTLPALSTMCEILKRSGCVSEEASQAATPYQRFERKEPNELWQTDFKGHFALTSGERCHPLTVLDDHSRFSLCIDAKNNERQESVQQSFLRIFSEYGLPEALLCDNGNPWGASQSNGHTRFEVWLMDLGILPIHGRPLHPQTQGKEERFHLTMKRELLAGASFSSLEQAQSEFDRFRVCYNSERPHSALGLDVPAQHYRCSARSLPTEKEPWSYPSGYLLRCIKSSGYLSYKGQGYFLSEAFGGLTVALRESSIQGLVNVYYRQFRIGRLSPDDKSFVSKKIFRFDDP